MVRDLLCRLTPTTFRDLDTNQVVGHLRACLACIADQQHPSSSSPHTDSSRRISHAVSQLRVVGMMAHFRISELMSLHICKFVDLPQSSTKYITLREWTPSVSRFSLNFSLTWSTGVECDSSRLASNVRDKALSMSLDQMEESTKYRHSIATDLARPCRIKR